MIRYYCQYSYGGFKTYRIKGETHEALTQIVTAEERYDFPALAGLYFDIGSAKILYRMIDANTLALIIREIPGPEKDTDNRPISCAVQFIGNAEDRGVLDRLAIQIANNLEKFEKAFAYMFDLRGGLHFEGDRLATIVRECEPECNYEGTSKLLNVQQQRGTVLLFVPFSDNFGRDEKVTAKILSELQLPKEALEENRLIRFSELMKMQYWVNAVAIKDEIEMDAFGGIDIEKLQKENNELQKENAHLRKSVADANTGLNALKERNQKREKSFSVLAVVLCVLLFVLVLANCKLASAIIIGLLLAGFSFKTYKIFKP